jgi:hypothetical protein
MEKMSVSPQSILYLRVGEILYGRARATKFCMNKKQSIKFGYTSKDFGRNVGFSTNCLMQPQKADIYATLLREYQQKNCACRRQCDTKRPLIASVVTFDGFFW